MTLTQDLKKEAKKAGFVAVGISNLNMLRELSYGKIEYVGVLKTPEEELPEVRSVILMGVHAWDTVFNIVADSSDCASTRNTNQGGRQRATSCTIKS